MDSKSAMLALRPRRQILSCKKIFYAILQGGRREDPLLEGNELEINQGGIGLRATISKFVIEKVVKNTLQKRYKSPDLYSFVLRSSKVLLESHSIMPIKNSR